MAKRRQILINIYIKKNYKIQRDGHDPLTSTCLCQCVCDGTMSSIYTGHPGVETLPTAPRVSKLAGRSACHRPSRMKSGVTVHPHPTPPHPGVSHSHKVISLVVSFVQPVIVWYPHDSAQTVPRDPHLQWAGRVRERRTVKDGFYRAGGMWITEEMLLNISICLSWFYFIFLLYGVKKSNQIKADGNAAGCKERQQL